MRSRRLRWLSGFVLVGSALAQAPVVPTDHYGPPMCGGSTAQVAVYSDREAVARAEQAQGAADPHVLLAPDRLENFDVVRYRITDYANCLGNGGCYWADLDVQYQRAEAALAAQVAAKKRGEKLAVVMDIDETALSGYCIMKAENWGYVKATFESWVVTPEAATGIPGALRFFREAKAAGVAVFFITGRAGVNPANADPGADQTGPTERNLKAAGFDGWAGLSLRKGPENGMSTIAYKSAERQKILERGYRIVMSVGDQWSDLQGQPQAEISVKLPNPFYFLP